MTFPDTPAHLSSESRSTALSLIEGATLCFANAEALHGEASILGNAGAWARGLALHQISLEECAKVEMIGAAVAGILMGQKPNLQRLFRAMTRHDVKNKANAYFLPKSEQEQKAQHEGDIAQALAAFKEVQNDFHESSNVDKNGALYVDPGEPFCSPLQRYTEVDFVRVRARNDEFLSLNFPKVRMLSSWAKDLDAAAASMYELSSIVGLETLDKNDPAVVSNLETLLAQRLRDHVQAKENMPEDES